MSIQETLLNAVDFELSCGTIAAELNSSTGSNTQRRQGLLVVYDDGLKLIESFKSRSAATEGESKPDFVRPAKCTSMPVALLQEFVESQLPPPSAEYTSTTTDAATLVSTTQHHIFTRQAKSLGPSDIVVVAVACNVVEGTSDSLYYDIFIRQQN